MYTLGKNKNCENIAAVTKYIVSNGRNDKKKESDWNMLSQSHKLIKNFS